MEDSKEITLRELAELVQHMRHNQKRFFNTHKTDALLKARELEKEVDAICNKITSKQLNLFG